MTLEQTETVECFSREDGEEMSEYIIELDGKHSIALTLALAEEMRGGDFIREEIVRCRDCKEFSFGNTANKTVDWCDYWCDCVDSPDGFCAWGERKEVDE